MQMTSPQLTELEAFWSIEGGWGDWKQDYRSAQTCAVIANVNRDAGKKPQPFGAEDFVLRPKAVSHADPKFVEKKIRFSLNGLAGVKAKKHKRRTRK